MDRWRIGDVRISRLVELEGPVPGTFFFDEGTPEQVRRHAWLQPSFANAEGHLIGSIHAFLIESGGRRIVVDTCVGNDKVRSNPLWNRMQTAFLDEMARAGFPPESVDTVVCTHLHVDHVGWNTRYVDGRWLPTFPKARYCFGRRELEHWSRAPESEDGDILGDSVRPILDAGLADLVEPDLALTEEVALEPTHGHTPGHVSVRIRSQHREAVITGDLMHHPIQCSEPDWAVRFDVDPGAARATRRAFLAKQADAPVLVLGTHFATPTAGRIVTAGSAWRFETADLEALASGS